MFCSGFVSNNALYLFNIALTTTACVIGPFLHLVCSERDSKHKVEKHKGEYVCKPAASSASCISPCVSTAVALLCLFKSIFKPQVDASSVHASGPFVEKVDLVGLFSQTIISRLFSLRV